VLRFVRSRPRSECNKSEISWNIGKNTKAKERNEAINELAERGDIIIEHIKGGGSKLVAVKK